MKRRTVALLAVLATGLVLGLWAFVFEPASLTSSRHELALPRWTAPLAGLRVAVLADLHVGSPFNGLDKLGKIVELANSLSPDLILLPGDFVVESVLGGTFVAPEASAKVLARLKAPLGVWACLGNHDWWLGPGQVLSAFEKQGIRVLEDASLVIAGHTHGGQVVLPFIGRPIVPSKYGQRFAYGHIVEDGRHLFVSPGLGTSIIGVRFFVPPEVTLLVLNP